MVPVIFINKPLVPKQPKLWPPVPTKFNFRVSFGSPFGPCKFEISLLKKLPINYIICDNGGYGIIKERLYDFHKNSNFIGMDFKNPEIDFVKLGNSLGVASVLVENYEEFTTELEKALKNRNGPNLLCVKMKSGRFWFINV